jgi:hypothetical protein
VPMRARAPFMKLHEKSQLLTISLNHQYFWKGQNHENETNLEKLNIDCSENKVV